MKRPSFDRVVPPGDDKERRVCRDCGFVAYENPKVVVGSVVTNDRGEFLLCRRAIEPRRGFWTLPAGYLELGESVEAGAKREALEEAEAEIAVDQVLAVYSIRHISQVQIMFRASLRTPHTAPGPETLELSFFAWDRVPWDDLAFPSVRWALRHHRQAAAQASFAPFANPPDDDGFDPVLGPGAERPD